MSASIATRSGESVDIGVPISDIMRDPRQDKSVLTDDWKAREVISRWRGCIDASRYLRLYQWMRNVLIVYGEDDIAWSNKTSCWLNVPGKRQKRYRTNLMPGRISYFAAQMTQSAPEWTTLPANDSIEAEQTAQFCDDLLRYAYREQRLDLVRYINMIQMCVFGLGIAESYVNEEEFVEPVYEMKKGIAGAYEFDERGKPVYATDENGKPRIAEYVTKAGIRSRVVSPLAFAVPPGVEWPLLKDAPYCVRQTWMTEQMARRRFPDKIKASDVLSNDMYGNYESMTSYLWQTMNPQVMPHNKLDNGKLLVLQYYEKACDHKDYYNGKVYTVIGNKLVGDDVSLFEDGHYPFKIFGWMPTLDNFYPYPWINPQVDPQSRLHQTTTHMMDHLGRMGSPNVIADKGSGYPEHPVFHYKVYFVNPGMRRPEIQVPPALPAGAYAMEKLAKEDINDVSLLYPSALGQAESGVTSGLQVRLLQDAARTGIGPVVRMHAAEFAEEGQDQLELYRLHGGDDKTIAIVGENNQKKFLAFKRGRIPIKQRCVVQEESLLVHYKSALEERATQLGAAGMYGNMLTDVRAQEKFRSAIRDPHLNGPLTPEEVQKQFIDEIHDDIINEGKVPPLEPWWDLMAHREAAQLRLLRESRRWDAPTKQRFAQYWQAIEDKIAEVEAQQKEQQMKDAQEQIGLAGQAAQAEAAPKLKQEVLRGVAKLTVESMKDGAKAAGADSGAAALMSQADEGEAENE